MSSVDQPNLVIPLASSYNTRGQNASANVFTNGIDQRKVNSYYETIRNSLTGRATSYLVKRPGVVDSGSTFGTSGQNAYLVSRAPGGVSDGASDAWVFSKSGSDLRASSSTTTTVIMTDSSMTPAYVGMTSLNGTETLVFEATDSAVGVRRTFYSTAIGTFTEITDTDFTSRVQYGNMEFMDGYGFYLSSNNRIYNSDQNTLASWGANNYITKAITQDTGIGGLMRFVNQLLVFGDDTVEVFRNAGNATGSPLVRVPELHQRIGLRPPDRFGGHYYAIIGQRLFFVGRTGGGYITANNAVFAYDGARYEKVSTPAIEKILASDAGTSVNKIAFAGKPALAIAVDAVGATTQRWLMFFPDDNEWFEWNSTVFKPVNSGRWFLGVGSNQHKLYEIQSATDNWQDAGTDYTMTHQFKLPSDGSHRKFMSMCGVIGDTARSTSSLNVSFSDDDWQTSFSMGAIDMTSAKKALFRCGSYSDRGVKLTHTGNTELRLEKFVAKLNA